MTSRSAADDEGPPGLAAALRAGTRVAHERAESSAFVADLTSGRLPLQGYIALVAQNHAIYRVLEDIAEGWRDDPSVAPLLRPELVRVPALERDLRTLLGDHWPDAAADLVVPATVRYVDELRERGTRSASRFVAHHYVRYLGDLSGGQILRAALERHYGPRVEHATNFYTFPAITRIKPFRDEYRSRLDRIAVSTHERELVVAEAVHAFGLNRDVFIELSERGAVAGW